MTASQIKEKVDLQRPRLTDAPALRALQFESPADAANDRQTKTAKGLKRCLDIAFALAAVFLLAPLLCIIAAAIKASSRGPVLFQQQRYGLDRKMITVYKFRTMRADIEPTFVQAKKDDPRVTRLGRLLRRTSLDELPQLFNVLKGSMSLVGPRPHPLTLDAQFENHVPNFNGRYRVKPGITGLAQIRGYRGETRHIDDMLGRIAYDNAYINKWHVGLDLKILSKTLFVGWTHKNAY